MSEMSMRWVIGSVLAGQYVLGFIAFRLLLRTLLHRRPRWMHLPYDENRRASPPAWLQRAAMVKQGSSSYREREALLAGCGFTADPAWYMLARTGWLALGAATACIGAAYPQLASGAVSWLPGMPSFALPAAGAIASLLALWDKPFLEGIRKQRAERIMKEIYIVSQQLLYYAGASLHLHVKLSRCLPYTRTIRGDLERMLGEWYHDAESAIARFKLRVGTAEGASFTETIEALRLHEHEAYYDLLRERLADYKAKLELAKDSRKESASYVLFVLAGVPILYMFQIFIYPWVQEAQKLFQSLNT